MNKFKSYVWMAAGFAVLVVVVAGITSAPAIAQIVKAALIKNVDERGRVPYSAAFQACGSFVVNCGTSAGNSIPTGKRLVITHISAQVVTDGGVQSVQLYSSNGATNTFSPTTYLSPTLVGSSGGENYFVANQDVLMYVETGFNPNLTFNISGSALSANATISGYLIDLTI